MQTLYGIQYLRAIAALAVVIFHAAERSGEHFAIGAAGVDVFFVISGFIMIVISTRRPQAPFAFLKDRFLRIAPSYWIVTSIMVFGAMAGLFPNLVLDPAHLVASYLFLPAASPNGGQIWPVLVQGWTLNYEMFFYGVFAATLALAARYRLAALAIAFGLLTLTGMSDLPSDPWMVFYTRPIVLEFLAGAILGRLWLANMVPAPDAGLMMIAASALSFTAIHLLGAGFNTWICGFLAVLLVCGILSLEKADALPHLPRLAYLGDASYSIYLWHTLAISVVTKFGTMAGLPTWSIIWSGAILGTLLGIAAYEGVERPLHHLIRHRRLEFRFARRPAAD